MSLIKTNPRMGFCAPKGQVIISNDYSGQEVYAAAALSKDPKMTQVFKEPKTKFTAEGLEYSNPYSCQHTLAAVTCINPTRYKDLPESQWRKVADDSDDRRQAKTLVFGIIFLCTAQSLSEREHVKIEVAESWINAHQRTYPVFHAWAQHEAALSEARGFSVNQTTGLIRWVDEANSKGSGESPGRTAVNYQIQSMCATMAKRALIRVRKAFKELNQGAKVIGWVHDEILSLVPGTCTIDLDNCIVKNGIYTYLAWKYSEEALFYGKLVQQIMIEVEEEMFRQIGSDLEGSSSLAISPYWSH